MIPLISPDHLLKEFYEPPRVLEVRDIGSFSLSKTDRFETQASESSLLNTSQEITKSIKLFLNEINNKPSKNLAHRELVSSNQYRLEIFAQNIHKNYSDTSNYANLENFLNDLLIQCKDKLTVEQKNRIYIILGLVKSINVKPSYRSMDLKTQTGNLRIVSRRTEQNQATIQPSQVEVNFFENILVKNFYNLDKRIVNLASISKFCNQDLVKCKEYLNFMLKYQPKLKVSRYSATQSEISNELIKYFSLVIKATESINR
jgi:hypothetical protein